MRGACSCFCAIAATNFLFSNTGHAGYPAAKLLHSGPIDQGMAYLSRRVSENKAGVDTADKERAMIGRELKRRLKAGEVRRTHRAA